MKITHDQLTDTQIRLLEFVKSQYFHVTLDDFLLESPDITQEAAEEALDDLRKKHIAVKPPAPPRKNRGFIGVTNLGYRVMGWI